jgi:hypothetical protein
MSIIELLYQRGVLKNMRKEKVNSFYDIDYKRWKDLDKKGLPPTFVCEILETRQQLNDDFNLLNPLQNAFRMEEEQN